LQKHPPATTLKVHCRPSRVRAVHVGPFAATGPAAFFFAAAAVGTATDAGGV